ncbi:hypothetical protein PHYPSEUDO_009218 [Phytophthora pseudosyringae]|uniref:Uncharacterized protein n=1 Tax=Phytophthora pseudosyringae TaxID=221518 RepID=A0A8T1WCP2_9STRA|nr:hypothetical protein PHYPSEUDO_009218 [Phytophthora pseudosyringae]
MGVGRRPPKRRFIRQGTPIPSLIGSRAETVRDPRLFYGQEVCNASQSLRMVLCFALKRELGRVVLQLQGRAQCGTALRAEPRPADLSQFVPEKRAAVPPTRNCGSSKWHLTSAYM